MFSNLKAELARHNIKSKELATALGVSEKTVSNKLYGRSEFTLSEINAISILLPDCELSYLFQKSEEE